MRCRHMTPREFKEEYEVFPEDVIVALEQVKRIRWWNKEARNGICLNLVILCGREMTKFVSVNSIGWKHRTWSGMYPVPCDRLKDYPLKCRYSMLRGNLIFNLWWGEQGKLRRDLCDHLIGELRLCIANGSKEK